MRYKGGEQYPLAISEITATSVAFHPQSLRNSASQTPSKIARACRRPLQLSLSLAGHSLAQFDQLTAVRLVVLAHQEEELAERNLAHAFEHARAVQLLG